MHAYIVITQWDTLQTSMCLSSSLRRLEYFSRRVKGLERLVVRVIIPGVGAPCSSMNLHSSSLYTHTYIHTYVHTYTHIHSTYTHMYTHTYIHMYTHTHTCTHMHTHVHTYIRTHIHAGTHTQYLAPQVTNHNA